MLWTIFVILVVLWLLGLVTSYTMGGFIHILLVLAVSSSEPALPTLMEKMERLGCSRALVGLVVPTGYTFNTDGTSIYMTLAALFVAQATNTHLTLAQQLSILAVAVLTSIRVVAKNPLTMALWGFIVAASLVIGSIPFFLGLTVVMPVLGHATWHLYRRAVEPDADPHPDYQPRERPRRFAADFPAALFPTRR